MDSEPSRLKIGDVGPGATVAQGTNITINQAINKVDLGSLPEVIKAFSDRENASKELLDEANRKRDEIAANLKITQGAVDGFFHTLGEQDVPPSLLKAKLIEIASQFEEARQRLAALDPDDPVTMALVEQAQAELDKGHPDAASALLQRAEEAELAAAAQVRALEQRAHAAADARQLRASKARESRGDVALTQLHYGEAAGHFGAAAGLVPEGSSGYRGRLMCRQADASYRQGNEFGDNAALIQSIATWKKVSSQEYPRERMPLDWALTQNNLGNALSMLGGRARGTARLEEAVSAYRATLEERTRARVALDWAAIQSYLDRALSEIARRTAK